MLKIMPFPAPLSNSQSEPTRHPAASTKQPAYPLAVCRRTTCVALGSSRYISTMLRAPLISGRRQGLTGRGLGWCRCGEDHWAANMLQRAAKSVLSAANRSHRTANPGCRAANVDR